MNDRSIYDGLSLFNATLALQSIAALNTPKRNRSAKHINAFIILHRAITQQQCQDSQASQASLHSPGSQAWAAVAAVVAMAAMVADAES